MSHDATLERASTDRPPPDLHPGEHLRKHVFPKQGADVYSCAGRLIAWLVVSTMAKDDRGEWVSWVGLKTIAKSAGLNPTTVARVMRRELVDGPAPLLARQRAQPVMRHGEQVNRGRSSFTYRFVWEPQRFAFARDAARRLRPVPSTPCPRRSNLPRRVSAEARPGGEPVTSAPDSRPPAVAAGDSLAQIRAWREAHAGRKG